MTAPVVGPIGTRFGKPGKHWAAGYHPGVDYPVPVGTRVSAPATSTILFSGRYGSGSWGSAYGIHVVGETVVGGVRYQWIVAHLSKTYVKKGQHVVAGQLIGLSGATGNVTGPHVHFEVRKAPFGYWQHVNPKVLIDHKPGPVKIDRLDPANYGPGHSGAHITEYGKRLVALGYGKHYKAGPGPVWGDADMKNTRDWQRAQGWRGDDADGLPGRETLRRVFA